MKTETDVFQIAPKIFVSMPDPGILLTTSADGRANVMNIGWAAIGIEWQTKIFIAHIRHSRFTHEILERHPEFTICAPLDPTDPQITKSLTICGTKSGRDVDKFQLAGLTKVEADLVKSPAIQEFPITLECKIVFQTEQLKKSIPPEFAEFYPQDVTAPAAPLNNSPHTIYYAKILKSYIIE